MSCYLASALKSNSVLDRALSPAHFAASSQFPLYIGGATPHGTLRHLKAVDPCIVQTSRPNATWLAIKGADMKRAGMIILFYLCSLSISTAQQYYTGNLTKDEAKILIDAFYRYKDLDLTKIRIKDARCNDVKNRYVACFSGTRYDNCVRQLGPNTCRAEYFHIQSDVAQLLAFRDATKKDFCSQMAPVWEKNIAKYKAKGLCQ